MSIPTQVWGEDIIVMALAPNLSQALDPNPGCSDLLCQPWTYTLGLVSSLLLPALHLLSAERRAFESL